MPRCLQVLSARYHAGECLSASFASERLLSSKPTLTLLVTDTLPERHAILSLLTDETMPWLVFGEEPAALWTGLDKAQALIETHPLIALHVFALLENTQHHWHFLLGQQDDQLSDAFDEHWQQGPFVATDRRALPKEEAQRTWPSLTDSSLAIWSWLQNRDPQCSPGLRFIDQDELCLIARNAPLLTACQTAEK